MSTFTAYLDDQDLIRIQKGEEHILPFYLKNWKFFYTPLSKHRSQTHFRSNLHLYWRRFRKFLHTKSDAI